MEIKIGAFTFGASSEAHFRHKLEHWDSEWKNTEEDTAIYSNLPHGSYRFVVQARSKDGNWTTDNLTIPVSVTPFFYQRKSFYAGSALALLAMIGILLTLRTRRLVRQNEQLEARIRERTSTLQETAKETAVLEEEKPDRTGTAR